MFQKAFSSALFDLPPEHVPSGCVSLLFFVSQELDSLYSQVIDFPDFWANHPVTSAWIEECNSTKVIQLPSEPNMYALLRSAIAIAGDIEILLRTALKIGSGILQPGVETLHAAASQFRPIRNHFAHLEDRLLKPTQLVKVSGKKTLPCGITYLNVSGAYHMVVSGNTIYFSDDGDCKETNISRDNFLKFLCSAKQLYEIATQFPRHFHPEFVEFTTFFPSPYVPLGSPSRSDIPNTRLTFSKKYT
ncbi:hypothetical protein GTP58_24365 [Duganella sp. CY15W]|uniref:hypothetical protein n=1 Tax=Duganella sp. CY15W TaxID=2692172 RepID=UPI00136B8D41|nr:hypothetical protein [Duganella sp. CY15W]MYM31472.1 hypothetical protein [Duganella sp. CY15W]